MEGWFQRKNRAACADGVPSISGGMVQSPTTGTLWLIRSLPRWRDGSWDGKLPKVTSGSDVIVSMDDLNEDETAESASTESTEQ